MQHEEGSDLRIWLQNAVASGAALWARLENGSRINMTCRYAYLGSQKRASSTRWQKKGESTAHKKWVVLYK